MLAILINISGPQLGGVSEVQRWPGTDGIRRLINRMVALRDLRVAAAASFR